jgi:hypothetical protein
MSMIDRWGDKVVLPRIGPDDFWEMVRRHYAQADPHKWKALAMLALRVNAGWSLEMIGNAFGHERGHVSRRLSVVCRELQETFDWSPDDGEPCAAALDGGSSSDWPEANDEVRGDER